MIRPDSEPAPTLSGKVYCPRAEATLSAEVTYLQLGIRGIDESISQNGVPVLNVGTTGEKDKKKQIIFQFWYDPGCFIHQYKLRVCKLPKQLQIPLYLYLAMYLEYSAQLHLLQHTSRSDSQSWLHLLALSPKIILSSLLLLQKSAQVVPTLES